jgi:hypothetical protein
MRFRKILIVAIRVYLRVCLVLKARIVLRVRLTLRSCLLSPTAVTFFLDELRLDIRRCRVQFTWTGFSLALDWSFTSGYSKGPEAEAGRFSFFTLAGDYFL